MERAKLANGKKTEPVNTKSARTPMKKTGSKPKAEKLVCRYCGSDDLAPSFIKRRDRRCRKCFSKRYGSAARAKKELTQHEAVFSQFREKRAPVCLVSCIGWQATRYEGRESGGSYTGRRNFRLLGVLTY